MKIAIYSTVWRSFVAVRHQHSRHVTGCGLVFEKLILEILFCLYSCQVCWRKKWVVFNF